MVRFFVSLKNQDLFAKLRTYFAGRPTIKSVLVVASPSEILNKVDKNGLNVLLWDLDEHKPDPRFKSLVNRYFLHIIYTSSKKDLHAHELAPATEFVPKPASAVHAAAVRYCSDIDRILRGISMSDKPPAMRDMTKTVNAESGKKIVAIASSTGGTNALEEIISRLPADMPPLVVVQHMPSGFTKLFADRLDATYVQDIREARSGDFLMQGLMLLAPADKHIRIVKKNGLLAVDCFVGNRIHGVMPAADVLFESIATVVKSAAVGVVLTGMGSDGARGLLQMKIAGCKNIGQNKETCVVYGMPKAAMDIGALHYELPIENIADMIVRLAKA